MTIDDWLVTVIYCWWQLSMTIKPYWQLLMTGRRYFTEKLLLGLHIQQRLHFKQQVWPVSNLKWMDYVNPNEFCDFNNHIVWYSPVFEVLKMGCNISVGQGTEFIRPDIVESRSKPFFDSPSKQGWFRDSLLWSTLFK